MHRQRPPDFSREPWNDSKKEHPAVRIELVDVAPTEMIRMAQQGRLDVLIALEPAVTTTPGFHWSVLRRIKLVLVLRADDPLAKLKRVPPKRLRDVSLVGLARENFPSYVPHLRSILKPHGIVPRFVKLENDGVSTLFETVEAYRAAAILADSVVGIMPRALVCRPFSPEFEPVVAKLGVSAIHPTPHAAAFARVLRVESAKQLPWSIMNVTIKAVAARKGSVPRIDSKGDKTVRMDRR